MKKLISIFVLSILLMGAVTPVALAASTDLPTTCDASQATSIPECIAIKGVCSTDSKATSGYDANCGYCCLMSSVNKVTQWLFYILMLVVVAMIIWGGLLYVFSSGDPTKTGKAKGVLTFAIVGLAVALLAKIIPSLVRFIIGVQ